MLRTTVRVRNALEVLERMERNGKRGTKEFMDACDIVHRMLLEEEKEANSWNNASNPLIEFICQRTIFTEESDYVLNSSSGLDEDNMLAYRTNRLVFARKGNVLDFAMTIKDSIDEEILINVLKNSDIGLKYAFALANPKFCIDMVQCYFDLSLVSQETEVKLLKSDKNYTFSRNAYLCTKLASIIKIIALGTPSDEEVLIRMLLAIESRLSTNLFEIQLKMLKNEGVPLEKVRILLERQEKVLTNP